MKGHASLFGIYMPPGWTMLVALGLLYGSAGIQHFFTGSSEPLSIIGVSGVGFFELCWWWVNRANWRYYAMIGTLIAVAFVVILLGN